MLKAPDDIVPLLSLALSFPSFWHKNAPAKTTVAAYDHVTAITEHSARTRPIDAEVLGPRKQLLKTANATWSRFLAQAQAPVPRLGDGAGAGLGTLVQFPSPGLRSAGSPGEASSIGR